ncbi:GIY-YIG nuclease family protein [Granulosicoccaceae sp. 1_MG-2023]|nr:GIY-YIG nuclease family protein [Granulosicoccaceae sp. 1_MG-2023]
MSDGDWQVYILRCADGTFYTGVTRELARRVKEHNECDKRGARYTRARRPVQLIYREPAADRRAACKREWAIKRLSRKQKAQLAGLAE